MDIQVGKYEMANAHKICKCVNKCEVDVDKISLTTGVERSL
jgi:hypothetical protein